MMWFDSISKLVCFRRSCPPCTVTIIAFMIQFLLPHSAAAQALGDSPALTPGLHSLSLPRADEPPAIAPFSAHYSADWKSMSVGTSDLDLKQNAADGTYEYTWRITARGVFRIVYSDDVIQKSWFSVNADHVRPEKYRAEQGNSTVSIDFDWNGGRAHGESEKKPVDLKLTEGLGERRSSHPYTLPIGAC